MEESCLISAYSKISEDTLILALHVISLKNKLQLPELLFHHLWNNDNWDKFEGPSHYVILYLCSTFFG